MYDVSLGETGVASERCRTWMEECTPQSCHSRTSVQLEMQEFGDDSHGVLVYLHEECRPRGPRSIFVSFSPCEFVSAR